MNIIKEFLLCVLFKYNMHKNVISIATINSIVVLGSCNYSLCFVYC